MRRLFLISPTALAAPLLLVATGVGCRHADLNRELVEREMRLQEDEIYRLQDLLSDCEKTVEASRLENAALRRELDQVRGGPPPETLPSTPPSRDAGPPPGADRPPIEGPPTNIMPPQIVVPGIDGPPPSSPGDGRSSWRSQRKTTSGTARKSHDVQPASHEVDATGETATKQQPLKAGAARGQVAKIVLSRRLTGGFDADRRLGDDGIRVVIEPRDGGDQIVRQSGDVAIVVIDPALSGDEARVARWDFERGDVEQRFEKTVLAEGIHLELPWPNDPPVHERLVLFVRLTTIDGDTFEASGELLIDLADDTVNE